MLVPQLSVAENIFMGNEITLPGGLMNYSAMYKRAEELMAELKMPDVNVALPVYHYGGGHQQLIEIAKALNKKAKLLILDEPTRGVDVGAKYEIYKRMFELVKQGVSIVMISSELPEVLGISDRVLVIGEGQLRGDLINDGLTQEQVLTAALGHPSREAA